jgi:hypothetical protein
MVSNQSRVRLLTRETSKLLHTDVRERNASHRLNQLKSVLSLTEYGVSLRIGIEVRKDSQTENLERTPLFLKQETNSLFQQDGTWNMIWKILQSMKLLIFKVAFISKKRKERPLH